MSDEVVIVVRLSAEGRAVRVEDSKGNLLGPVDTAKEPIQGTVKAMKSMVLLTTESSPACTWVCVDGQCFRVCL